MGSQANRGQPPVPLGTEYAGDQVCIHIWNSQWIAANQSKGNQIQKMTLFP